MSWMRKTVKRIREFASRDSESKSEKSGISYELLASERDKDVRKYQRKSQPKKNHNTAPTEKRLAKMRAKSKGQATDPVEQRDKENNVQGEADSDHQANVPPTEVCSSDAHSQNQLSMSRTDESPNYINSNPYPTDKKSTKSSNIIKLSPSQDDMNNIGAAGCNDVNLNQSGSTECLVWRKPHPETAAGGSVEKTPKSGARRPNYLRYFKELQTKDNSSASGSQKHSSKTLNVSLSSRTSSQNVVIDPERISAKSLSCISERIPFQSDDPLPELRRHRQRRQRSYNDLQVGAKKKTSENNGYGDSNRNHIPYDDENVGCGAGRYKHSPISQSTHLVDQKRPTAAPDCGQDSFIGGRRYSVRDLVDRIESYKEFGISPIAACGEGAAISDDQQEEKIITTSTGSEEDNNSGSYIDDDTPVFNESDTDSSDDKSYVTAYSSVTQLDRITEGCCHHKCREGIHLEREIKSLKSIVNNMRRMFERQARMANRSKGNAESRYLTQSCGNLRRKVRTKFKANQDTDTY